MSDRTEERDRAGDGEAEDGADGETAPQVSAAFRRAAQGGMVVRVPDDGSAHPRAAITEANATVTAGVTPPDGDGWSELSGGVDHHVVTDMDALREQVAEVKREDGDVDGRSEALSALGLDGDGADAVHYRRPRSGEGIGKTTFARDVRDAAIDDGADVGAHRTHTTAVLSHGGTANDLERRTRLLCDHRDVLGVRYTVPHPHPEGPAAADGEDDRTQVLVLPDPEAALDRGLPDVPSHAPDTDPDVLVAPDTANGRLFDEFTPEAMVVTNQHLGGPAADRAEQTGTHLGMPDTGEDSVVELGAQGIGGSNLAEPGETPDLERTSRGSSGRDDATRGRADFR